MYRLTNGIEFLKSLPPNSVDGIFTDPPWGCQTKIAGQDQYRELLREMDAQCERILKPGARVLIWWTTIKLADLFQEIKYLRYRWMVHVEYIPPSFIARLLKSFDPILYFSRPESPLPNLGKFLPQNYLKTSRKDKDTSHPCARPVDIVKKIIHDWFRPGEYIIDPFAGSDTTGVACRELKISYDTCEIDPKMYETGLGRNAQGLLFEQEFVAGGEYGHTRRNR